MDTSMDMSQNSFDSKKKASYNIVNLIDTKQVAREFVEYFYKELGSNFHNLISNNTLRQHTKVVYENKDYTGDDMIPVLANLVEKNFTIHNIASVDSGSRVIHITVVGLTDTNTIFSHTFLICHHSDLWYIKHALFM